MLIGAPQLKPVVRRLDSPNKTVHRLSKAIFISIAVWWLALITLFIFPVPLLSWFALLLSLLTGFVVLILSVVALFKDKRRQWPILAAGLNVLTVYLALFHLMYFGAFGNFYLHRRYYETTARAMIAAPSESERERICGNNCMLMSSDPPRVAFHYVAGYLNWHDIVYDPSGAVVRAKSYDERKQLNVYFGGAEHLTGDWYLCHFGD
jgi:hypothetical protein